MKTIVPYLKPWATPLTTGAFLLLTVTGILLFFHLDSGMNKLVHEWLGWALVVGGVAHVAMNFGAFKKYFKKPTAVVIMALFGVALAGSFLFSIEKPTEDKPMRMVMAHLEQVPLASLAPLVGKSVPQLQQQLAENGAARVDMQTDTIKSLSRNRHQEMVFIRAIFAQ